MEGYSDCRSTASGPRLKVLLVVAAAAVVAESQSQEARRAGFRRRARLTGRPRIINKKTSLGLLLFHFLLDQQILNRSRVLLIILHHAPCQSNIVSGVLALINRSPPPRIDLRNPSPRIDLRNPSPWIDLLLALNRATTI